MDEFALKDHIHSGASDSGRKIRVTDLEIDSNLWIRADGTVPLTSNWDASSFSITAQTLIADGANSLTLGTASSAIGSIIMQNANNANTVKIQSGITSASYSLTMPLAVAGAGEVLTDAAGDGILSWAAAGAEALNDLSDVAIASVANTELLQYDGSSDFVNRTILQSLSVGVLTVQSITDSENVDLFKFKGPASTNTGRDGDTVDLVIEMEKSGGGATDGEFIESQNIRFRMASGDASATTSAMDFLVYDATADTALAVRLSITGANVFLGDPSGIASGTINAYDAEDALHIPNTNNTHSTNLVDYAIIYGADMSTAHASLVIEEEGGIWQMIGGDGSDAITKWSAGAYVIQTDESTNTDSIVEIKGKGTGIGHLRFYEGVNYVGFKAPALTGNQDWTLPTADASVANSPLVSNASGVLSWGSVGAALDKPTAAQINGGGSDFWVLANDMNAWTQTNATIGDVEFISAGSSGGIKLGESKIDPTKEFALQFVVKNNKTVGNPNSSIFWGIGASAPDVVGDLTDDHVGFILWASSSATLVLEASVADGSTQTTAVITGITHTNFNSYRIEHVGSSMLFYVNGSLEATLSTNLPDDTTMIIDFVHGSSDVFTLKNGIGYAEAI